MGEGGSCKDGLFRVVSYLGLWDSNNYEAVKKCLRLRYTPGNKVIVAASFTETGVTWKVGKPLEDYVRELRTLVEKAYPCWTVEQQEVLYLFIQGLFCSSCQEAAAMSFLLTKKQMTQTQCHRPD